MNRNVSSKRSMKCICITMVAITRLQFGDWTIRRLKGEDKTVNLTRLNANITLLILCAFYIYATFDKEILILWIRSATYEYSWLFGVSAA